MKKIVPLDENHSKLHRPGGRDHCHQKDGNVCIAGYGFECYMLCGQGPQHTPPGNAKNDVCLQWANARMLHFMNPCDGIEFTKLGKEYLEENIKTEKLDELVPLAKSTTTRENNFSNLAALFYHITSRGLLKDLVRPEVINQHTNYQLLKFLVVAELLTRVLPAPIWLR